MLRKRMETSTCTDMKTDSIPDGISDEEDCEPDPRIQLELDKLNTSSTEINQLENELDEARTKYRIIVSGTSGQMEIIARGRKKSIQKAREYFKLTVEAKLAQSEALKSARQYQTAVGVYKAAKETVALAESRLIEETNATAAQLTSAWQEMLNHAISKVSEAEQEKAKSEQNHKRKSTKYGELQSRTQVLEKKFRRSIKKARPYFELKAELDIKLMQQKQNVSDIQTAIRCSKMKYTESLRKLERISEEIHQTRREKFWSKIPRMPGVGADTDSDASGLSELDLKSAVSSEWSEYGDEEFDTESVTDDEVFDIHADSKCGDKGIDIRLETETASLKSLENDCETRQIDISKDSAKKTDKEFDKRATDGCELENGDQNCEKIDKNDKTTESTSSPDDSGISVGNSSESDSTIKRDEQLDGNEDEPDDITSVSNTGEACYSECDIQSVERPSPSGAED